MLKELRKVYSLCGWAGTLLYPSSVWPLFFYSVLRHTTTTIRSWVVLLCARAAVSAKDLREYTCWLMSTSSAQLPSPGISSHKSQPPQQPQLQSLPPQMSEIATLYLSSSSIQVGQGSVTMKKASMKYRAHLIFSPSLKNQSPVLLFIQCLKSWPHILCIVL